MPTMHALQEERALDTAQRTGDLPALSTVDRVALRLGVALILWGQRHAGREDRADEARRLVAGEQVSEDARVAFERRASSGTTW